MTSTRNERGVALILFSVVLLALLVFTAFAVDMGAQFNERRQDQNAADAAALAGAFELITTDTAIKQQVDAVAEATLEEPISTQQWNSCGSFVDADTVDTPVSGANCITYNAARTQLQVRIPVRTSDAFFGGVVGVEDYSHSAMAIAQLGPAGFGGVLPLPIANTAGAGDGYVCVRTDSSQGSGNTNNNPLPPPCSGQVTGSFGSVNFGIWAGNDCQGQPKERWARNVAQGVDHLLSIYGDLPHGTSTVIDTQSCGATPRPNAALTNAVNGLTPQDVGDALFRGINVGNNVPMLSGRLQRVLPGTPTAEVGAPDNMLDDRPLWYFITPGLNQSSSDVPDSCEEHNFDGVVSTNEFPSALADFLDDLDPDDPSEYAFMQRILLQRCFAHYNGDSFDADGAGVRTEPEARSGCLATPPADCTGIVFGKDSSSTDSPNLVDIQYTTRFAYVPQLHTSSSIGDSTYRFGGFRAVYLQRLLGNCNPQRCAIDFEPGVGYENPTDTKFGDGLTVFVFPTTILPNRLGQPDAIFNVGSNLFVSLVR